MHRYNFNRLPVVVTGVRQANAREADERPEGGAPDMKTQEPESHFRWHYSANGWRVKGHFESFIGSGLTRDHLEIGNNDTRPRHASDLSGAGNRNVAHTLKILV